jgi:putative cell wall-binding protein
VVGGTAAVSSEVENALGQYTDGGVTRSAGADRYETAAAVALAAFDGPVPQALIATGEGFADALAGGAVGAATDSPLLLIRPDSVPAATAAALRELQPSDIAVLGGTQVIADSVLADLRQYTAGGVNRLAGNDREQTAAKLAEVFWPESTTRVYLASGQQYPDALAAGPAAGRSDGPLLLTRQDCLPDATHEQLERLREATVVVIGGQTAVSDAGLTTSCSGAGPRLVISDTTPEPGDESGTVIQGTGYAPDSSVEVLFNGQRFTSGTADNGGTFATEYFPTTSDCGRQIEVVANGTDPTGAALSRRGSLTVTC